MNAPAYSVCKALAYPLLATVCSCDHTKAKAQGYRDGWQMLLDKHDDNEMVLFCTALPQVLSPAQCRVLFIGLAQQYTEFSSWDDFAAACSEHPDWKPSQGPLVQHLREREAGAPVTAKVRR